jgi:hypothetical protein
MRREFRNVEIIEPALVANYLDDARLSAACSLWLSSGSWPLGVLKRKSATAFWRHSEVWVSTQGG